MPAVTREGAAQALFDLVSATPTLVTSSRRLRPFDQVDPQEMPALFQMQKPDTVEHTQGPITTLPPKRTMHFDLYVYTSDAVSTQVVPSTGLNNIVDNIETKLRPLPDLRQDLGGACWNAWIEGSVEYFEGVTEDGKSIAVIPVAVLLP